MIEQITLKNANISDKSLHLSVQKTYSHKQGNNHSLDRSEVTGSGKKLFKQKGTGKARHGSGSVSQFRGGGMAHGPVVHSHAHSLNKKVRKLGLRSVLSNKFKLGKLIILEAFKSDGKTSTLKKSLNKIGVSNALIISGKEIDENFIKAAANIRNLDILSHNGMNVYDIVKKDNLIILDDSDP